MQVVWQLPIAPLQSVEQFVLGAHSVVQPLFGQENLQAWSCELQSKLQVVPAVGSALSGHAQLAPVHVQPAAAAGAL